MLNYIYSHVEPVDKQPSVYLYAWRILEAVFEEESLACIIGLRLDGGARRSTQIVSLDMTTIDEKDIYRAVTLSGRVYLLAEEGFEHDSQDMRDVIADFESQSKVGGFKVNLMSPGEWNEKYGRANIH